MDGVERAIVLEDLQEHKEASRIALDIQDTRRYFESQGGGVKSSKIKEGQDPAGILERCYNDFINHEVELNKPFAIPKSTFDALMSNVKVNRAKMMPPKDGCKSRSGRGANEPDDDIFDKALEEDEEETKHAPKRIKLDHINRLVDLSTTEEDHFESYTSPDNTMAAGKTKESKEALPLIRRFNRYAQR
ncbi:RNA polymerase II transcription factor B subunit 1, partial [Mortierella sp. AD010]